MGLRGPAPKARDQKILEGTFRKDRDQGPTLSPAPLTAIPRTPSYLSKEGKAEWRRMAGELNALGALGSIDLGVLEGYCAQYGLAVRAERAVAEAPSLTVLMGGVQVPHPLIATARLAWTRVLAFAAKLGATPADRTRVKPLAAAKPAASADPWARIAGG